MATAKIEICCKVFFEKWWFVAFGFFFVWSFTNNCEDNGERKQKTEVETSTLNQWHKHEVRDAVVTFEYYLMQFRYMDLNKPLPKKLEAAQNLAPRLQQLCLSRKRSTIRN